MDLSGECVLCSGQSNYIFIQPDGQKICRICSDAIKNCQECQNSTYCTKCETNEYLNESNHQCMDCSQPSMYKFGSNDGSGQCKLCSAHLNNCINCNESDHCYLCEQDYILDSNGKCTNCTTPNVFKNNANECKSCSSVFPNCDICNITINSCLKCQENFFFDEENQCTSCLSPENYKENPKDGSGKCKSCSTMENCQYCEDSKKCQKCYVNNYLDSTRHCGKCNQDEMFILGKNNGYGLCLPCSSSLSNCINCFGNSTSCGFCQSGYYIHKDNGACILCDAEYFPKYYKDGDSDGSGNCERCSTIAKNCEICEGDPTSCKKCENGYYIEEDGQCSDCSQENKIKAGGNEGYGTCKFCSTCILCSAINNCKSCINVSETKILCEECMKGHYLTENGSCEKCSKECFNCRNKENICMECNPGYFSDDNNKSHCVKCDKNNTLLSKNICYTLSLPSASLNNSYIQNGDLKLSEYDNSLHISLDNLCWKEGNNETNIYFILASKDASFKKYDLDWIKMNLKENKLSKYDHEDNEWKLFGNSHQNNLKLFLRYDFFYTLKYYCSNNFTQSKANQYNLVEIITKKNENGIFSKIFMNFENILNDELNEKLISKIICILENLAHISGNKLIKSIFRRKNITCEENSPHSRYLLSIPDENPTFNIQTIVFDIGKDFLQSKDNTSFLINSTLKNENFLQNFNVLLQKEFMHSNSILLHRAQSPQLTTFEYVPESGKEFAVIPTVSFSIKDNFNVSAIIDVKVLSQKGLLIMGLVENYPANIPTFLNLKNEENNYYNQFNYLWRQTVMVQENHNFIVKLSSLLPKHNYTLYYATENFLLTTHSDIFYLKFEQKSVLLN